jgi:hypothetical protein
MRNTERVGWLLAALLIASCATGVSEQTEETGLLRAVAAADPQSSVEVSVDNELIAKGRAFEVLGRFLPIAIGNHEVQVRGEGWSFTHLVRLFPGTKITLIPTTGGQGQVVPEVGPVADPQDPTAPTQAVTSARFVHGSTKAGAVDVYVSEPGAALATLTPLAFDLVNGNVSAFHELVGAPQRIRITASGDLNNVLFDSGIVTLPEESNLSVIVLDRAMDLPGLQLTVLTAAGSTTVLPLDPCANDVNDNDIAHARVLGDALVLDGLCSAGDVDVFGFAVDAAKVAVLELNTTDLGSDLAAALALTDAQGVVIDSAEQAAIDAPTSLRVLLFGGATYYLTVADQAGAGGATFTYGLKLSLLDASAVVAATGGNFSGASNNPSIGRFDGEFVALSVTDAAQAPVDYKVQVRVAGVGATYAFTYDPAKAEGGVLRVMLNEGNTWLPQSKSTGSVSSSSLLSTFASGWYSVQPVVRSRAKAITRAVSVAFPTGNVAWNVDDAGRLDVATVSEALLNDTRDKVRVTFAQPAGASRFDTSAFGRMGAATGAVTGAQSPATVTFNAALAIDEAFAVEVRATSGGALALPLPPAPLNVSEFLFYSDAE